VICTVAARNSKKECLRPGGLFMLSRPFNGLWCHPDFIRLWSGQTISGFGSLIGATAIGFIAILVLHATPFQLGILAAVRLAPGFLIGLIAGAWIDRLRRRPILIGADIGRCLLLATIPSAAILGRLHIDLLYFITFFVRILSTLFDVAYESYLPTRKSGANQQFAPLWVYV
jgi:hypothetical protein